MRTRRHSAIGTLAFCMLTAGTLHAASVKVAFTKVPDAALGLSKPGHFEASATFTGDGDTRKQLTNGWSIQYRFRWTAAPKGTLSDGAPAPSPDGWTAWGDAPVAAISCAFPNDGMKTVRADCQVRLTKAGETPGEPVAEGNATTPVEVIVDLAEAVNVRCVAVGTTWMRIRA